MRAALLAAVLALLRPRRSGGGGRGERRADGGGQVARAARGGAGQAARALGAGRRAPLRGRAGDAAVGAGGHAAARCGCATTAPAAARPPTPARSTCAQVGPDRARGPRGWVYKVGNRAGTTGAADPCRPVRHRAAAARRPAAVVLVRAEPRRGLPAHARRAARGRPPSRPVAPLRVTVRGYDDNGRGVPVAGALVRLGGAQALTGADGVATVTVPAARGRRAR